MSKLYTEEEVLRAIMNGYLRGIERNPDYLPIEKSILKNLTPIELPTNEEIGQEFKYSSESWEIRQALEEGAKWMRDKIKGGNK